MVHEVVHHTFWSFEGVHIGLRSSLFVRVNLRVELPRWEQGGVELLARYYDECLACNVVRYLLTLSFSRSLAGISIQQGEPSGGEDHFFCSDSDILDRLILSNLESEL